MWEMFPGVLFRWMVSNFNQCCFQCYDDTFIQYLRSKISSHEHLNVLTFYKLNKSITHNFRLISVYKYYVEVLLKFFPLLIFYVYELLGKKFLCFYGQDIFRTNSMVKKNNFYIFQMSLIHWNMPSFVLRFVCRCSNVLVVIFPYTIHLKAVQHEIQLKDLSVLVHMCILTVFSVESDLSFIRHVILAS